jgi:hypothetical protein
MENSNTENTMARVTLNAGFAQSRGKIISDEDQQLIDNFINKNGTTLCPPNTLPGNEVSKTTHARIMEARKAFRANQRAKKAKNK